MMDSEVEEGKTSHGARMGGGHFNASTYCVRALTRWGAATVILFFVLLSAGAFLFWIGLSNMIGVHMKWTTFKPKEPIEAPPNRYNNTAHLCRSTANYTTTFIPSNSSPGLPTSCPHHFRWIYEDLRTWNVTGISRQTLESAKKYAHFRLIIVKGKVYLETYNRAYQTRDVFTIWGIVQLVRLYPGRVPDLELMFRCEDTPAIRKSHFPQLFKARGTAPPPPPPPPVLFQYCGRDDAVGIVFPDWSFWGWAEVNIKPWNSLLKGIIKGSERIKWKDRIPYAFWKGNPESPDRKDLMTCNVSQKHEWNARVYKQDWVKEFEQGYKHSNLEDQCNYRYKIYVEGWGWSVSEKYILACDSMALLVKPQYYDFFTRSLVPLTHYWPIRTKLKCRDVKFAVEWGNNNTATAQEIGRTGSEFIREGVNMENVYSYMLHLLTEYAKLLKFEPTVPPGATEVCSESMAAVEWGLVKEFMEETMVKSPSDSLPCIMPAPIEENELHRFLEEKRRIMKLVEMWEGKYWKETRKKHWWSLS